MKISYNIFATVSAALLLGMSAVSCDNTEDIPGDGGGNISVNTQSVSGSRAGAEGVDNSFMVLFWKDNSHLNNPASNRLWPVPYLAAHAEQPVDFYQRTVFDTRYPYPDDRTAYLYATGYAPGEVLAPDNFYLYRRLIANFGEQDKARYDFLGCDLWSEVYKGSQDDPFSQDKNKLYFRHLTAKLLFYADRDKNTMENKQYVRNVKVTGLYMSIDGGKTYTSMYTPSKFEWKLLEAGDFTSAYTAALDNVKRVSGNESVTTVPKAGYKAVETVPFAGDDRSFELQRHASDRVPVNGLRIDSCYVSNNIVGGVVQSSATHNIRLKMDISAEMSFDPNFPVSDASGSTTDDMTFTRTWRGVELDAIYEVDAMGNKTTTAVHEFKPGMEYRIYIHFHRSGVNLVAIEQPWDVGGVHYISISGAEK